MTRAVFHAIRAVACAILCAGLLTPALAQTRVGAISVEGNQRIPDSTIIRLLEFQPGQVASNDDINDAVQRVMRSGLFETADIRPGGGGLVVSVVERPTVNRINIEGNQRMDDAELLPFVTLSPRRVYSAQQAEADANAIADFYSARARISASVTPRIIRRSDNRVDVVFEVSESRVVETSGSASSETGVFRTAAFGALSTPSRQASSARSSAATPSCPSASDSTVSF